MIGLIAAMESELNAILQRMDHVHEAVYGGIGFYEGTLQGKPITVALSGVGKVAAAMAATLMCQVYHPECLLSVGVAGGLVPEQMPGDLVLSESFCQADFDTSPLDGPEGLGKVFAADETLLKKARQTAKMLRIPVWEGMIATQDLFMAREEDYARLMRYFPKAACSEMEGGAVAQVAASFQIPVLAIRSLSDVVHHKDNPLEFEQFVQIAAARAADFMEAWCAGNIG